MPDLRVGLDEARPALLGSVTGFVRAAGSVSEHDLLAVSRCHGWTRLDVVVHLLDGWRELLGGLARPAGPDDGAPDVDAATYWTSWSDEHAGSDGVDALMWQRRRTAVYRRPALAVTELRDIAEVLGRAVMSLDDRPRSFQGHVLTAGDLCATWAVEIAVHHLDLLVEGPPPSDALSLARRTFEAVAERTVPPGLSDIQTVLLLSGR